MILALSDLMASKFHLPADLGDLERLRLLRGVRVHNLKGSGSVAFGQNTNFDFDFDHLQPSIFRVDSNRAMLGVVTDGDERGAEIQSVSKASAAEKAGLKKGDVITSIAGKKVFDHEQLSAAVADLK